MHNSEDPVSMVKVISSSEAEDAALMISGWFRLETRFEKLKMDQKDRMLIYEIKMI